MPPQLMSGLNADGRTTAWLDQVHGYSRAAALPDPASSDLREAPCYELSRARARYPFHAAGGESGEWPDELCARACQRG